MDRQPRKPPRCTHQQHTRNWPPTFVVDSGSEHLDQIHDPDLGCVTLEFLLRSKSRSPQSSVLSFLGLTNIVAWVDGSTNRSTGHPTGRTLSIGVDRPEGPLGWRDDAVFVSRLGQAEEPNNKATIPTLSSSPILASPMFPCVLNKNISSHLNVYRLVPPSSLRPCRTLVVSES